MTGDLHGECCATPRVHGACSPREYRRLVVQRILHLQPPWTLPEIDAYENQVLGDDALLVFDEAALLAAGNPRS